MSFSIRLATLLTKRKIKRESDTGVYCSSKEGAIPRYF